MRHQNLTPLVLILAAGTCGGNFQVMKTSGKKPGEKSEPWVEAAKTNKEMGPAAYAQLLAQSPKRAAGEPITVFYYLDDRQVVTEFKKEIPADKHKYLRDAFVKSMSTTLGMLTSGFGTAFDKKQTNGIKFYEMSTEPCAPGATWYETMRDCRREADVFLLMKVELRRDQTTCPDQRGYRVSANYSSAYTQQDFSAEVTFCRQSEEGGTALSESIVPQIDTVIRATLPAAAQAVRLTPGYRYDWWVYRREHKGGSSWGDFD
jgi:hypothetical protein